MTDWRAVDFSSEIAVEGAVEVSSDGGLWTFHRLPRRFDHRLDDGMRFVATSTSGVRLRLTTDSTTIRIRGQQTMFDDETSGPSPVAVVDVTIGSTLIGSHAARGGGVRVRFDSTVTDGFTVFDDGPSTFEFDLPAAPAPREVDVWLPCGQFRLASIEVLADAEPQTKPVDDRRRWVHHGSSISHGLEATSPARTWPALVARRADLHLTNLGFGGGCHLDSHVARSIAALDADIVTLELGINIVHAASMTRRTFGPAVHGFLDIIRDAHPDVPTVIISPIFCPGSEARSSAETDPPSLDLPFVRTELAQIVERRKPTGDNISSLDGRTLLGPDDVDHLPDGLHPNGPGHELIAHRLTDLSIVI